MLARRFWVPFGLAFVLGCSSRAGDSPPPADAGTGAALDAGTSLPADAGSEAATPVAQCLTGQNCVADRDCPSGSHCNLAQSPPACQMLYCGAAGSRCSEDVQCRPGSRCQGSACVACTMCGARCVDLATDPQNCGRCGNVVTGAQCVDGRAACVNAEATLCGAQCVTLDLDAHCGACNRSCGDGQCDRGHCNLVATTRVACDSVCRAQGLTCLPDMGGTASYECSGCPEYVGFPVACGEVPPPTMGASRFVALACRCAPRAP